MLGLFPVNLGFEGEANGDGESFIALSLSCDGVHWSSLTKLVWTTGHHGRTWDHPVDGVVLHGDNVYFMVTRHSNPRHARACRSGILTAACHVALRVAGANTRGGHGAERSAVPPGPVLAPY